jgi:hypothetical protein
MGNAGRGKMFRMSAPTHGFLSMFRPAAAHSLRESPCTVEPVRRAGILSFALRVRICARMLGRDDAARTAREVVMLDERQTLAILAWTLGSMCLGTKLLSALSLH